MLEGTRNVALVRASRIGDFLCATPSFRALRSAMPEARLSLVALPLVRDLADRSPYIDRFLPFPGFPGIAEQFFDARSATDFLRAMQEERFDLAIQIHGSGVYANPFTLLLGARRTVGFVRDGDPAGRLDVAVPFPENGREAARILALPLALGAPDLGPQSEFPLWEEDIQEADRLLEGVPGPLLGLHPGTWEEGKRWPLERYRRLAASLRIQFGGTVVLIGGEEEAGGVELDLGEEALNLIGRTTLPVAGAVIARLSILVTNDSGPAHIAYALRCPSVTLFASTDPARWGPPPGPHGVVQAQCMEAIGVDEVVRAAEQVMA